MGKKKDYVLEKALQGDLDAIENILGQVYAPLFDLGYHLFGATERVAAPLGAALEVLGRQLAAGKLEGSTPFLAAGRALMVDLEASLPPAIGSAAPLVAGLDRSEALALLARCALDLDDDEIDEVLALAPGRGAKLAELGLAAAARDENEFRDRLDEISAGVSLPEGLVDRVVEGLADD